MNRINLFRSTPSTLNSVSWGRKNFDNASPLIFAALLIVCSVAVGCSSDQPKPVSSEIPVAQPTPPVTTSSTPSPAMPVQQAAAKPWPRRSGANAAIYTRPVTLGSLTNPVVRFDFHMISRRGRELPPGADEFTAFLKSYIAGWAGRASSTNRANSP